VSEVHDHSGEEARFRQAEEETRYVKLRGGVDEAREDGGDAPGNHDAGGPFSGAPTLDNDGAGNLKQDVADVEHGHAQAVDPVGEAKIKIHAQRGERNVGSIKVGDDVEEEYEGKEA
jgi:hypothetical protein